MPILAICSSPRSLQATGKRIFRDGTDKQPTEIATYRLYQGRFRDNGKINSIKLPHLNLLNSIFMCPPDASDLSYGFKVEISQKIQYLKRYKSRLKQEKPVELTCLLIGSWPQEGEEEEEEEGREIHGGSRMTAGSAWQDLQVDFVSCIDKIKLRSQVMQTFWVSNVYV